MKDDNNTLGRDFIRGACFGFLMAGIAVLAFFLIRFGTIGPGGREGADVLTDSDTMAKLRAVQRVIKNDYLEEADAKLLESGMFKGIAAGLNDIYADYYSPEEFEAITRENEGAYIGIGVVFEQDEKSGDIFVRTVYEDSPAMKAGVEEGDILKKVGNAKAEDYTFTELIDLIKGKKDEDISLTFLRGGEELQVSCRMEEVAITNVTCETDDDNIAYITIQKFDHITISQFEEALRSASDEGVSGIVIDVRDNPGGLLESVTMMLDDLLDECVLLTTVTREGKSESVYAEDGRLYEGPAAVLVNSSSASASEVFAGVLQYYGAACIVGEATFGKGVVQSTYSLSDGSAIKLTTEKYLVAGENDIDGVGVQPDISVDETAQSEDVCKEEAKKYLLDLS